MVKIIQYDDTCVPHVFHRNFEKVIKAAYRWLCVEYQDGDRIFAFGERLLIINVMHMELSTQRNTWLGFSRGAYQVRALAGMIEKVHLCYLVTL
jgi:uncharacterized protein (DUF2235 family)